MVVLVICDGENVEVDMTMINQCQTLKNLVQDTNLGAEGAAEKLEIPLPNVNAATLKHIINWCDHHKNDATVVEEEGEEKKKKKETKSDDIPEWDVNFLSADNGVEISVLCEIIHAANYLHIQALLDRSCKTIANMMKGKSSEEIRQTFNIPNDFTPEEEAQIKVENAWCEDH
ncbi:hypothetical protein PENTCL1PPCAC_19986 [Pristionchus entomophagus]|uniref:Skp1-related protein n=1 Tax=Pristionchus entomophagus TaxID=358040 RepID=A0AAV5TU77_9BILA|nr:hypothetical protein PENTCL1PPCAC_19986 [Pristionchus entomophagus]